MSLFRFPGRRTPGAPIEQPGTVESAPAPDEHAPPVAPAAPTVILRHERVDRLAGLQFLRAHGTGTMSFMHRGRLVVEPVSCVLDPEFDEWLYLRALPGSVIGAEEANQRVAVAVRTEHSPTEWVMAIVYGRLVPLTARGSDASPRAHARAVDLLQASAPDLATASAESRGEETLFRVSVDMVHARSCHAVVE